MRLPGGGTVANTGGGALAVRARILNTLSAKKRVNSAAEWGTSGSGSESPSVAFNSRHKRFGSPLSAEIMLAVCVAFLALNILCIALTPLTQAARSSWSSVVCSRRSRARTCLLAARQSSSNHRSDGRSRRDSDLGGA